MLCILSDIKVVRKQVIYNRNLDIRQKMILIFLAFKYGNISLACQKLGYQRSYFYFWFKRLKGAGFDIQSLIEQPQRLLSHPKRTPVEIVDKIISL